MSARRGAQAASGDVSIVGLEDIGLKVMGHGCSKAQFSVTGVGWDVVMNGCEGVNTCFFQVRRNVMYTHCCVE